ncbi:MULTISPECIES: AMP-binding protein [unclassified Mycobacterium]|uniref:AMP-binding protein n=1 Tax=unclassified Mycobacterium TaxID=2642494 RepID=UPI001E568FA8
MLAARGVGPGSLVGLSMRRGIDLVVALVAIMKAGGGYFPIDPGYPRAASNAARRSERRCSAG